MRPEELEKLRYPIGKFARPAELSPAVINSWIDQLEEYPEKLSSLVQSLGEDQLEMPYRPGGWTIRQVVHHVADSHHNSYIRFKWALTEDEPVIKPYDEKGWATLIDTMNGPIEMSLDHLKTTHKKLVYLLRRLTAAQLQRCFIHPDDNSKTSLAENIGRYAWHGAHHYQHIAGALEA